MTPSNQGLLILQGKAPDKVVDRELCICENPHIVSEYGHLWWYCATCGKDIPASVINGILKNKGHGRVR